MIDERALETTCATVYPEFWREAPKSIKDDVRRCVRDTLETYEAALWQPISEIPDYTNTPHPGTVSLVCVNNKVYVGDAYKVDDYPVVRPTGWHGDFIVTAFRSMPDPPKSAP